jgi:hypothetical protein
MKKIICSLLFLAFLTSVKSQSITESKEWNTLLSDLDNEKWQDANSITAACLKKVNDTGVDAAVVPILRYMFIYSESGMMNDGKVSQKDALNSVKGFMGLPITLPGHPVATKQAFNSLELSNNTTDTLFVTATNKAATDIFCFEYIVMKEKWPIDDFKKNEGKMFRLSGTLTSITVEGHMLPRFRLIIDNGQYENLDN